MGEASEELNRQLDIMVANQREQGEALRKIGQALDRQGQTLERQGRALEELLRRNTRTTRLRTAYSLSRDRSKQMTQTVTLLKVFLASPSDVAEEREILDGVIKQINVDMGDIHNVRLELLKWETHVRPEIGTDPQESVIRQIGDDFAIFLGIMWGRFGSPTPRAESGTEEEFNRTLSRRKDSPESVDMMFYFKDAGIPPSELDPEQLAKVLRFKEEISSQGVVSVFKSPDEFRTQARTHLIKIINDWSKRSSADPETAKTPTTPPAPASTGTSMADPETAKTPTTPPAPASTGTSMADPETAKTPTTPPAPASTGTSMADPETAKTPTTPPAPASTGTSMALLTNLLEATDDDDDDGIFDLMDHASDAMDHVVAVAERISTTINDLGAKTRRHAEEVENLTSDGAQIDRKIAKRIANNSANDFEVYVEEMSLNIPRFHDQNLSMVETFEKIAMIYESDMNADPEEIEKFVAGIQDSRDSLVEASNSLSGLRGSMTQLPRMTNRFNRARRRAVAVTDDLLEQFRVAENQLNNIGELFRHLIGGNGSDR